MNAINDSRSLIANLQVAKAEQQDSAPAAVLGGAAPLYGSADAGFLGNSPNALGLESIRMAVMQAALASVAGSDSVTPQDFTVPGLPGGLTSGAPGDVYTRIPNADNMPYFDQGNTNGCGSTSLAMILNYYGISVSREDVDKEIRRADNSIGATPEDELQFARDHGLEAEEYNNGSWEEVKSMIDKGYPVMASVTGQNIAELPDGNLPDGRHQIAITGYEKGADGKEYVLFHDPNFGGTNQEKKISVDDFKKAWGKEDFGVKNFFMVFAPKGSDLPASRMDGAQGAMGTLNGLANISNGFDRIFSPDDFGCFLHGIPEFFGGLVQTVGCGIGALLQKGAEALSNLVDGIPVLENIVQPFTDLVSGFGGCVADIFNGFGKACNSIGGAFDSLCDGDLGGFVGGVADAAGDVVSGVGSAISDAAGAIGDAVGDLFSGW